MKPLFYSDFICPNCRIERDRLLYTSCQHKICEICKIRLFKQKGNQSIHCPFCNAILKKRDISEKSGEESAFENEMRIRNTVKSE